MGLISSLIKTALTLAFLYHGFVGGSQATNDMTYKAKIHVFETIVRFNKMTRMESMSRRLTGIDK